MLISHKARQLNLAGLFFVPHGDGGALDLMVFQVSDGNTHPALRSKLPFAACRISQVEDPKVTRIVGIGVHQVDVTGDPGQPGKEGIAVAVASAIVGLLTSTREDKCQQRGEPKRRARSKCGGHRVPQKVASKSVAGATCPVDNSGSSGRR